MSKHVNFISALAVSICLSGASFAEDAMTGRTVIATVDGTDITLGHMIQVRASLPQQYSDLDDDVLFTGILDQLIHQTLLSQSLRGDEPFRVTTAVQNERRSLLAAAAIDDVLYGAPSDDAVQKAYEEEYSAANPEREYNAAHILVETEEEAKALIAELDAGMDFAKLAREKSTGPSGPSGGDLGWFGPGMMVPPFEKAVMALAEGAISAPVKTQFGWHIIRLVDSRLTKAPPLAEVRSALEESLQNSMVEDHIAMLKKSAKIVRSDTMHINHALLKDTTLLKD